MPFIYNFLIFVYCSINNVMNFISIVHVFFSRCNRHNFPYRDSSFSICVLSCWSIGRDSNLHPSDYQVNALPLDHTLILAPLHTPYLCRYSLVALPCPSFSGRAIITLKPSPWPTVFNKWVQSPSSRSKSPPTGLNPRRPD